MDRSLSCTLPGGERGNRANGKDPRCLRSSEIDLVAALVQQQYVIGFSNFRFWRLVSVVAR
jgi:hypothetical protein